MAVYKMTLAYDGTDYCGFQLQPNGPTIQGQLEEALGRVYKTDIKVKGCSRTDAGVHARMYVCSYSAPDCVPPDKLPLAIRAYLPNDICVYECERASDTFNARYDNCGKTYCYTINTARFQDVFARRFEWHYPKKLNVEKMRLAAACFIGKHDFAGFMSAGSNVVGTERTVTRLDVIEDGTRVKIFIRADGYLYNMVRIIAGTLAAVGIGSIPCDEMEDIIKSCDRTRAGMTAPPQGLTLYQVHYE